MKKSLTNLCENFVANIELIYRQKGFKIVNTKIMPMCSYAYITSGKAVEPERLLECLKLVESRGGGSLSGIISFFWQVPSQSGWSLINEKKQSAADDNSFDMLEPIPLDVKIDDNLPGE